MSGCVSAVKRDAALRCRYKEGSEVSRHKATKGSTTMGCREGWWERCVVCMQGMLL